MVYGHDDDDGGRFMRAPLSRWVGLSFPPGGFSGSLSLHNADQGCPQVNPQKICNLGHLQMQYVRL